MSDIGIRFDGLVLAAAIAISAAIFAIVLLVVAIMATFSNQHRKYRIGLAKVASVQTLISLACFLAVILTMGETTIAISSPDWLDWLTVPWIMVFLFGVVRLIRFRPPSDAA